MKVLIVSDSHKYDANLAKILREEKPIDLLIHCGDAEGTEANIKEMCECPLYIVRGNNDFFSNLERDLEFKVDKYKVFLTHGHNYRVSMGVEMLLDEAKIRNADIVIFGHTHKPLVEIIDGIVVINPGSISFPRQEGKIPTYVMMDIDENGDATYFLKNCTF